jgi:hypothetical protein
MKAVPQNGLVYKWLASETGPFTGEFADLLGYWLESSSV